MPHKLLPDRSLLGGEPGAILSPEDKIRANFREYSWLLNLSEDAWRRGQSQAACVYASMATLVATHRHCGFFSSPRLERMLISIGRSISDQTSYRRVADRSRRPKRVLHVCTEVAGIGGLAKMLARLMREDTCREHSLVLTRHKGDVPAYVAEAVAGSGGTIHRLDLKPKKYVDRALDLRNLARRHDLIVLHIYSEDVVPMLAFAQLNTVPPVIFLNHADHLFWLGPSISDVVINLRDSGEKLSIHRRGVAAERNVFVPTLLSRALRKCSIPEAKQEIGLDPDTVLLLSVARATKYRTVNNATFADTHVPILTDNPNAHLFVVGAGEPDDWSPARAAIGGRIVPLAPVSDPSIYYQAADIYVDSYPFVSATSMMEAAGFGLPIVSRFYAPEAAEIIGNVFPTLKAATLLASNDHQYVEIVRKLIADQDFRRQRGELAERAVAEFHYNPGWMHFWEAAIEKAFTLAPLDGEQNFAGAPDETPTFGEPDIRMNELFGFEIETISLLRYNLRHLPIGDRLARWQEIRKVGGFIGPRNAAKHLLSDTVLNLLGR